MDGRFVLSSIELGFARFFMSAAMVMAIGCTTTDAPARCTPGELVPCTCSSGASSRQVCGADGAFDACACEVPRCTPGVSAACVCETGDPGAQSCDDRGMFGACSCAPDGPPPACVPGASAACACPTGEMGAQVCDAAGRFGACVCEPGLIRCIPAETRPCTCEGGYASWATCDDFGVFGRCDCSYLDASGYDAGGWDAGAGICDPYVGEVCGCDVPPRPTVPTVPDVPAIELAAGPSGFVAALVVPRGVVVVTRTGAQLYDRRGSVLAAWNAVRQVTAAAADDVELVIADRGELNVLRAEDLTPISTTLLTAECSGMGLLSCRRVVCRRPDTFVNIDVYDLSRGTRYEGTTGGASTEPAGRFLPVPGVDGFVDGRTGYYTLLTRDPAVYGSIGAPRNGTVAFLGMPATHMVTNNGALLRLDDCVRRSDASARCLVTDGTLGTLVDAEVFQALDTGSDGDVYALTSVMTEGCRTGCRVQRIDPVSRRIVSERPVEVPSDPYGTRYLLLHDPWAGRVLVASAQCDYSGCNRWSVQLVPYE